MPASAGARDRSGTRVAFESLFEVNAMLEELIIRSFKAFEKSTAVPLKPFTVLVGPNGSGKSTILQAIDLLGGVVQGTLPEYLKARQWEYSDLPHLRARDTSITVEAHVRLRSRRVHWRLDLGARRYAGIRAESVAIEGRRQSLLDRDGRSMSRIDERSREEERIKQTLTSSWLATLDRREDASRFPTLVGLAEWARGIRGFFFLDPLRLREKGRGRPDDIGRHGENLAPFLAQLRDANAPAFRRLTESVRKHYRRLVELRPRKSRYGWTELEVAEKWNGESARFNARQVSDGLLRMIAVAAMHEIATPPSILMIDEVENGLHPHLVGGLIGLLRGLVRENKVQVIVTTHSPVTVSYCPPENVMIVHRTSDTGPSVVPLIETRSFKKLGRHFDPGELWYNLGESRLVP